MITIPELDETPPSRSFVDNTTEHALELSLRLCRRGSRDSAVTCSGVPRRPAQTLRWARLRSSVFDHLCVGLSRLLRPSATARRGDRSKLCLFDCRPLRRRSGSKRRGGLSSRTWSQHRRAVSVSHWHWDHPTGGITSGHRRRQSRGRATAGGALPPLISSTVTPIDPTTRGSLTPIRANFAMFRPRTPQAKSHRKTAGSHQVTAHGRSWHNVGDLFLSRRRPSRGQTRLYEPGLPGNPNHHPGRGERVTLERGIQRTKRFLQARSSRFSRKNDRAHRLVRIAGAVCQCWPRDLRRLLSGSKTDFGVLLLGGPPTLARARRLEDRIDPRRRP